MRWDFEKAIAETVVAYIEANQTSNDITGIPVIAFYDPRTATSDDRIIVMVGSGETKEAGPGEAEVEVEVAVVTDWEQPTAGTAVTNHFARVNCVRDLFAVADPAGALDAVTPTGIAVTGVNTQRRFETQADDDSRSIYSMIELIIHCNTTS